jgi:hypothetical protein
VSRTAWPCAPAVALLAFALYDSTLLPDFDLGDTGALQATVGSPTITPRDAYPLYFAVGDVFLRLTGSGPARALNLASAVLGAAACGGVVLVATELSTSILAGAAAGLLFAGSYTYWSQAVISEVYALHALLFGLTLLLLLRWSRQPTMTRLGWFFALYALGFGNHLSMVLLVPGYALFLLLAAPRGWRSMFEPKVVALAVACAVAGALQYAWNFRTLWLWPNEPHGWLNALQIFWFDVTKTDWRETMVMQTPAGVLRDRLAMYVFDVRQQFGVAALLAPVGLVRLLTTDWRRGVLMLCVYGVNFAFAFGYNVGDTHVFYLPSHLVLAVLAAPGIVLLGRAVAGIAPVPRLKHGIPVATVGLVVTAVACWRIYDNYPALDRSADRRPTEVLDQITAGADGRHAIFLADLNWQLENGLSYFSKEVRPDVVWARLSDVMLYAPALFRDNLAVGRNIILTEAAHAKLASAYGPLVPAVPDSDLPVGALAELARNIPAGTRYALCVLRPNREASLDVRDLRDALSILTNGTLQAMPAGDYAAIAGVAGNAPSLTIGGHAPFRARALLAGVDVDVRMESWLASDTIRRMGFGQVVANRHHALIVERGVSFVAIDADGRPLRMAYAANIFAPQRRWTIRADGQ